MLKFVKSLVLNYFNMIRLLLFLCILFIITSRAKAQVEALYVENRVEIIWDYSDCNLVDYYVIEKSKNGTNFREFLKVKNSKTYTNSFLETDHNPYDNISFYRIRYVNFSGKYYYSEVVAVKKSSTSKDLSKKLNGYNSLNVLVVLKEKSNGEFYSKLNIQENNGELVSETLNENIKSGEFMIIASENDDLVGNSLKIINRNPTDLSVDTLNTKSR